MNLASDLRKKAEARAAVLSGLSASHKRQESKRNAAAQIKQHKEESSKPAPASKGSESRVINRPQSYSRIQPMKVNRAANESFSIGGHGHVNRLSSKDIGSMSSVLPTSSSSSNAKRGRTSNGSSDVSANIIFDFINRHHIQQTLDFVNPERVREYLREQLQSKAIILENNRPLLPPPTSVSGQNRVSKRKLEALGVSFEPVLPDNEQLQQMEQQWTTYYYRLTRNCDSTTQLLSRLSQIALVGARVTAHMCSETEESIQGTILAVTPQHFFICQQITPDNQQQEKEVMKVARRKCELLCVRLPKKKGDSSSDGNDEKQLVIHCAEQLVYHDKQLQQRIRGRKRRRKN